MVLRPPAVGPHDARLSGVETRGGGVAVGAIRRSRAWRRRWCEHDGPLTSLGGTFYVIVSFGKVQVETTHE